ncbi:MAG: hypothetical protein HDR04_09130 [Lachnospiraceae bacterium]|nr:hypothetical protein [Lachnospiraceae bacterium]
MFATYKFYISEYLMGRTPSVPETEYAFWESEAECELNRRTFGRLQNNKKLVTESVKKCTCAITELLYKADEVAQQNGGTGPLASYSNDGESGSFDLSESIYTESGKKAKIADICNKYLGRSGLLYPGV